MSESFIGAAVLVLYVCSLFYLRNKDKKEKAEAEAKGEHVHQCNCPDCQAKRLEESLKTK